MKAKYRHTSYKFISSCKDSFIVNGQLSINVNFLKILKKAAEATFFIYFATRNPKGLIMGAFKLSLRALTWLIIRIL